MWLQKEIILKPRARGFHLITAELLRELPELRDFKVGMMNVFILHTSASLTINENADPTVRQDFESYFNRVVPENAPYFASIRYAACLLKPLRIRTKARMICPHTLRRACWDAV
ncbi:MAG TPA: YjbQ family protein [Gallionellaceae bacterium]|nr:YjbQ family protein [Gallionellaceae bacterium]